jgi:hypothetical protein
MRVGEKRDGTYVPCSDSGASWSAAFTLERLPDLRRRPAAPPASAIIVSPPDEGKKKT